MKKIKHVFTETGEVRTPRKNEGYSIDNTIYIQDSDGTTVTSYHILTYEGIEEEWKPKENECYYCISSCGVIMKEMFVMPKRYPTNIDTERFNFGNCFPTEELAESALKQIKDILKGITQ